MVAKAREYFGCESLAAVKLVDAPYGSGVNVHSPVLFEEVLTNFVGTEQVVHQVSVLSLALLEESSFYAVEYDVAGTTWGKGRGCSFFGCSSEFAEFCSEDGCTFDGMSIGYCSYAVDSDSCKVMWPAQ